MVLNYSILENHLGTLKNADARAPNQTDYIRTGDEGNKRPGYLYIFISSPDNSDA